MDTGGLWNRPEPIDSCSHTGSQCRPIGIAGQCTFLSSQLMKNFAMSALFFSDII